MNKFEIQWDRLRGELDAHVRLWQDAIDSTHVDQTVLVETVGDFYRWLGHPLPETIEFVSFPTIPQVCTTMFGLEPICSEDFVSEKLVSDGLRLIYDTWLESIVSKDFDPDCISDLAINGIFHMGSTWPVLAPDPKVEMMNALKMHLLDKTINFINVSISPSLTHNRLAIVYRGFSNTLHLSLATLCGQDFHIVREAFERAARTTERFASRQWNWREYIKHELSHPNPPIPIYNFGREYPLIFLMWEHPAIGGRASMTNPAEIGCYYVIASLFNPTQSIANFEFLKSLIRFYGNGGWSILPTAKIAYVLLKPRAVHVDAADRLHGDGQPALVFQDGVRLYIDHGLALPPKVAIHPERLTVREILEERNVELRRAMISRKGLASFLREADPTLLDADYERHNPNPRKLYRLSIPRDEPIVALHVVDPAKKRLGLPADVLLRVPPSMETCAQAAAWTFGFGNPADYRPSLEE